MDPLEEEKCVICLSKKIDPFKLPCKHEFCYLCLKRVAEYGKPCPCCNAVIPEFVFEGAKISEESIDLKNRKWMYSGRNNGWWYFSSEHDEIIEKVWTVYQNIQQGTISLTINILGRDYEINFEKMTQTSEIGVIRNIKRIDKIEENEIIKGVSGLQIVKKEDIPDMPEPKWLDPEEYIFQPSSWDEE